MNLRPRYQAVLQHVARYRLTLRETVGALLLPGDGTPTAELAAERRDKGGHVLARLRGYGLLNHHHHKNSDYPPFPGGIPFYTLTPEGAKLAGVPVDRAEELGTRVLGNDALTIHLATLWFATMRRERCHRLEPAELIPLLGKHKFFDNVPHCLVRDPDGWRIYRIYVVSTDIPGVVEQVRKQVVAVLDLSGIADWLPADYAFAVLAPDERFCLDLKQALDRAGLAELARVRVALAPTPATLRDAIHAAEGLS